MSENQHPRICLTCDFFDLQDAFLRRHYMRRNTIKGYNEKYRELRANRRLKEAEEYRKLEEQENFKPLKSECRFDPPQKDLGNVYPSVSHSSWCGKWQLRKADRGGPYGPLNQKDRNDIFKGIFLIVPNDQP
jgi:hypothetical protein